ncbi:uncharacterized protein LOC123258732 isoform X1 [Cotesia glomerata]|uniref:uncharacterized protein LOC123258732 isoform X1 n=1 Tax=Cotesia glomerata TaxID=32391 RepID=UPI001D033E8A|nr:uncharacterized protein LOC123258732 isoform X1 [Cotesia glomerata]
MSESDKKLTLVDYDSEGSFEKIEDSGNAEKDPALQIKTEKTEDTLYSLSQFHKGLMQQTKGNPDSSTKSSDIKDVKESLKRMNNFSTPVKPGQSTSTDDGTDDRKNESKDDDTKDDDDFKDKSENTKIKIRSSKKMLMLGNKDLEDMKRLMLESNKQTQEIATSIARTARRLEEVSAAMLDALKVMTKGYKAELDREKTKAETAKKNRLTERSRAVEAGYKKMEGVLRVQDFLIQLFNYLLYSIFIFAAQGDNLIIMIIV